MKIGLGCTTFNRPKHIEFWAKQVSQFSDPDAVCHIANDSQDRRGVAFRKNECLRELMKENCDYIFLFDDDSFPIKSGWEQFFIDHLKRSGQNHFCYLFEHPECKKISTKDGISSYTAANGVMMVMTKEAIERVGGFDLNFGIYGGEHAGYSQRIYYAGLNTMGAYLCPDGAKEYIYSLDLQKNKPEIDRHFPKHKSSMPHEEALRHAFHGLRHLSKPTQIYHPL